jgi:ABC-type antimicrobial peptide transport system permease subunit
MLHNDGAIVGRRLRLSATGETEWEIIGVVADVQVAALDADAPPVVYLSHLQAAENRMTLVMRTTGAVASIAGQLRTIVKRLDPAVPLYSAVRLDHQLSESKAIFSRRFPMILCGVFALAALALTLIALYAICTHEVLTRRREFGIRLALGGSPDAIRRSILNDAMLLGMIGIGIGSVVAIVVSRSMRAVLFGVTPMDWRVYGVVGACVLVSAMLAALRPALRAGSVNPSVVMREE